MFPRLGICLFWILYPYAVACLSLLAQRRLNKAEHPRKEAMRLGRQVAAITGPLVKPNLPTKGLL